MRLAVLLLAVLSAGAQVPYHRSGSTKESGWRIWAPRDEIAPRGFLDPVHYRTAPASLALSGNSNSAEFGGWQTLLTGVQPGAWYRLTAYYRAEAVPYERGQVVARLDWRSSPEKRAGQPEYAWKTEPAGDWKRISLEAPAPQGASGVAVQLLLQNAPGGTVWWDDISLERIAAPPERPVRVVAVNLHPNSSKSSRDSVEAFLRVVDSLPGQPDIVLLPEGITVVGTRLKYADVAEPVPGPTTERLGEMARKRNCYIVAGIYEREGSALYNTAVLIDRTGRLAGKYRKVYLPREELEGGLTPGSDFPVFLTDFGKVGLMICWDVQYADPARALALRGAELILMPIWGGNLTLGKARAIENHVFLASSGYDYPTMVIDPDGEVLSIARENGAVATATLNLNRRYVDAWLGDMGERFQKEIRLDVPLLPR